MDNDIGNLIYIILAVLVFIFSALRKRKKPARRPGVQTSSPSSSLFDLIENTIEPDDEYHEDIAEPVQQPEPQARQNLYNKTDNNLQQEAASPKHQKLADKAEKRTLFDRDLEVVDLEEDDEDGYDLHFDLKKAVIYAEILNRKPF